MTPGISNDTITRTAFSLCKQAPVRCYMDAKCNGTFSHVAIEVWLHDGEKYPAKLDEELAKRGFAPCDEVTFIGEYIIRRWEGKRETK